MCVISPLGTRVSIYMIFRDCELEISRIPLIVDLKVMVMSEFNVILGMDWLTAYRVVTDCECRRVTAYAVTPRFPARPDWRIRTEFGV